MAAKTLPLLMLAPAFLLVSAALAADGGPEAQAIPIAAPPSAAELTSPDWILEGKKKFVQTCAYCHGVEGQAGKTRSFKTREGWDPQVIHDTISDGRVNGPNVMPSWKGSIPDAVVWKIVAYIKSLSLDASGPPKNASVQ